MCPAFQWEGLLRYIEDGQVVPVVGERLLTVRQEGAVLPFYDWLAGRLARRLELAPDALPPRPGLNDVVCAHLGGRGNVNDIYLNLRLLFDEAAFEPPPALLQLAGIGGFSLFVSLGFDSLLAGAIDRVRFGGAARTRSLLYTPNGRDQEEGLDDLPKAWKPGQDPVVFHLFGKLSAAPDYAVSDEDLLEFVHALQQPERRPPRLFDELTRKHLLFLGCRYSDWLARFILRLSKDQRLSEPRSSREFLVDSALAGEGGLVLFCDHFSRNTRLLPQSAEEFIAELARLWHERHPPQSPAVPPAAPPDMPQGAVFISYASEDREYARQLRDCLKDAKLDPWLDLEQLEAGDYWDGKIQRQIKQCALFVPLISCHTEACERGYFRREWYWAEDEAKSIYGETPFILPLRLDYQGPPEEAKVPEAFKKAQWSAWADVQTGGFISSLQKGVRAFHKRRRG